MIQPATPVIAAVLLAGMAACHGVRRQPEMEPSREKTDMLSPSFSIECAGERPSKPPRRAFVCAVRVGEWANASRWLLLPASLDHPLGRTSSLEAMELVRTTGGQEYLRGYGEPGFVAIRLPEGAPLEIQGWEFSTLQDRAEVEAWLVEDVQVGVGRSLGEMLASVAPGTASGAGPALLRRWEMEDGVQASVGEPVVLRGFIAAP